MTELKALYSLEEEVRAYFKTCIYDRTHNVDHAIKDCRAVCEMIRGKRKELENEKFNDGLK